MVATKSIIDATDTKVIQRKHVQTIHRSKNASYKIFFGDGCNGSLRQEHNQCMAMSLEGLVTDPD